MKGTFKSERLRSLRCFKWYIYIHAIILTLLLGFYICILSPPSGNILEPPTIGQKSGTKFTKVEKKTIRGKGYDSDSGSDED